MARPFGSKTRPQIRQFMNDDDIRDIMAVAINKAKKGDVIMAKFLLEQNFGKAPQPVIGEDGNILQVIVKPYESGDKDNKSA